ncbi:MAG: hypothetical protein K2J32_11670 [Ruminococcus sp.]|nr:hypothetical protein [Ruminococcus sp.]
MSTMPESLRSPKVQKRVRNSFYKIDEETAVIEREIQTTTYTDEEFKSGIKKLIDKKNKKNK